MRVVAACCATSQASLANWAALRSASSGPGLARNFSNAAFLAFTAAFCRSAKLGSLKLVIRLHHDCVPFAFNRAPCHHRLPLQHVHDITNFPKASGDVGGYTCHSARRAKLAHPFSAADLAQPDRKEWPANAAAIASASPTAGTVVVSAQ